MKDYLLLAMLFATSLAQAQTFILKDKTWTANIQVAQCDATSCEGAGSIELNTGKHRQTFTSKDLRVFRFTEGPPFRFADFLNPADYNFDGKTDIAISQGSIGPYGTIGYKIYVQTTSGRFILSDELSSLTENHMGLPEVDSKNRLLKVEGKSGPTYRYEAHYRVRQNKRPALQEVYLRSEQHNATGVEIEEKTWRNDKMHSRKTFHPHNE